jgi:hypothetical protein
MNLSIAVVATAMTLLLCELAARRILHPADYLNVEMLPNDVLGFVPSRNTVAGGFDAWGFRNREVPKTVDIVTIGDSHTYGNTATMDDSWPSVLGGLTGRTVYNLGLGGYGPNQYIELLRSRALGLKPQLVICGFYMGDDFENAFVITYGLEHWTYLRELPRDKVTIDRSEIWEPPPALSRQKTMRIWLSRHSLIYQLLVHGPVFGRLQGEVQIKNAARLYGTATSLSIPQKNILEAFRPVGILRNLDQRSDSVREGMRITFKLLKEMNEITRKNAIQFLVAVIPTKEMVFSQYLEHNSTLALHDTLDSLIANERLARGTLVKFLTDSDIRYVDTLPALTQSLEHELYVRTAADMHPNRNGYRVIAEAVYRALMQNDRKKEVAAQDR